MTPRTRSAPRSWAVAIAIAVLPSALRAEESATAAPIVGARDGASSALARLRAAFFAGDLVTFERLRVAARALDVADAGAELSLRQELALWEDLARLVRCLPLGAVDEVPASRAWALRQLVRVERIRLEALLRDGRFRTTPLVELLGTPPLFVADVGDRPSSTWVRWPVESERWPTERIDPRPELSVCPAQPGARRESDAKAHARHAEHRARALREAVAALLPALDQLPGDAAGRVALAYVSDADASVGFEIPSAWRTALATALARGEPPYRSAGRVLLARAAERAGAVDEAGALYRAVLEDPTRTDAEDSRARVRLVGLSEPAWSDVLDLARGARAPRAVDRAVLANAEARALYALGRWSELETFGRAWLRTKGAEPVDAMTLDLLFLLGLELSPSAAIAWMAELGPSEAAAERIDQLGRVAIEQGALALATALYDHLRDEAAKTPGRRSPTHAADEVRWLAERARIEFHADDAEAFAGFVQQILARATADAERPLARFAPHREITRLCQDLVGRLAEPTRDHRDRPRFAAVLHAAAARLSTDPSRWRPMLADLVPTLKALAGSWDVKLDVDGGARRTREAPPRPSKPRRLRVLGEVVVPRLPPRIEAPDVATEAVEIDSFLVTRNDAGVWTSGAPWGDLAAERREIKKARALEEAAR